MVSLKRLIKLIKLSSDWPREKKREKQISNIKKNEREDITVGPTDIKWIKECYEQLYFNKFDNLDEMDKVFEIHQLPKLTEEDIDNLGSPMFVKEIEFVVKNLTKKILNPKALLVKSTKHLREK